MKATEKEPIKKPYHSPQIFVYGDIRELTESNNLMTGSNDGMTSGYTQLKTR